MTASVYREAREGRWLAEAVELFARRRETLTWEHDRDGPVARIGPVVVAQLRPGEHGGVVCEVKGFEWRSGYQAGRAWVATYSRARAFPSEQRAIEEVSQILLTAPWYDVAA